MAVERWLFDGWELTERVARDWASRDGASDTAAYVGVNAAVPNRRGEIWRRKLPGAVPVVLDVWLAGTTRTEVDDAYRTLIRAVRRGHRLVTVERYMASGEVLTADVELVGQIQPVWLGQRGWRATLTLSVPAGVWKGKTVYTEQTTAGSTLPKTLALTSFEPSTETIDDLVFTVSGPITNPSIYDRTDGVDGDWVQWIGTLSSTQTIIFNSGTWSVSGTGGLVPSQLSVRMSAGRLLPVPAGRPGSTPTVQLRGTGGGTQTRLTVSGSRSYAVA